LARFADRFAAAITSGAGIKTSRYLKPRQDSQASVKLQMTTIVCCTRGPSMTGEETN
jgi:hypothetical protein